METKPWAIGLVLACTIFTSIGALCIKKGVQRFSYSFDGALSAYPVLIGLFFYFIGFIMLTISFKHGELSVLFPFVSLSFVWVAILSYIFLAEKITIIEMAGVGAIVAGVILIGIASRKKKIGMRG